MVSSLVTELLAEVHAAFLDDRSGTSRDPIAELRTIDPDAFGLCLATVDGHLYEVGDTRARFPIQSISKPFTYGIALEDRGARAVAAKIDVEPSGEPYSGISLDPRTGRPRNPMVNAGAIAAAALVAGTTPAAQFDHARAVFRAAAERELELSEAVLAAEVRSGHRNRAIGHLLREFGILEEDPAGALDVYLRLCSLLVDCRDLALMAATLANAGVQPRTGERVFAVDHVDRVLSVMTTCGMYDAAGDWVAEVGLPAKSGVGGGIIAALPGQLAVAVYSPRLDEHGNSVRGVAACRRLSQALELHFLHVPRGARSAVQNVTDVAGGPSLRERPAADEELLRQYGRRAQIFELHGDLLFAGAETIVRRAEAAAEDLDVLILDVRRVGEISDVTRHLLLGLRARLGERGCATALIDPARILALGARDVALPAPPRVFSHVEAATAWAEDLLLARHGGGEHVDAPVALRDHPLLTGLGAEQVTQLCTYLDVHSVDAGERIVHAADDPAGLHLLLAGRARSSLPAIDGGAAGQAWAAGAAAPDGAPGDDPPPGAPGAERVATLAPGTSFGQAALITGRPHAFDVDAERSCEVAVLTPAAFARLGADDPVLRQALIENLLRTAYDVVDRSLRIVAGRVGTLE